MSEFFIDKSFLYISFENIRGNDILQKQNLFLLFQLFNTILSCNVMILLDDHESNHSYDFVEICCQFVFLHLFYKIIFPNFAFPKEEYVNLACSIICLRLGCIFSPIQYSYLPILSYDKSDILLFFC